MENNRTIEDGAESNIEQQCFMGTSLILAVKWSQNPFGHKSEYSITFIRCEVKLSRDLGHNFPKASLIRRALRKRINAALAIASQWITRGLRCVPISLLLWVNMIKGMTAKGSARLNATWLKTRTLISSQPR